MANADAGQSALDAIDLLDPTPLSTLLSGGLDYAKGDDQAALAKCRQAAAGPAGDVLGLYKKAQRATGAVHAATKGGLRARMGKPPLGMANAQAHHDLPRAKRFRPHWERTGLDINDPAFGRWVSGGPAGNHQKWSAAYNREWGAFFDDFPRATRQEILAHMKRLRADPRFQ